MSLALGAGPTVPGSGCAASILRLGPSTAASVALFTRGLTTWAGGGVDIIGGGARAAGPPEEEARAEVGRETGNVKKKICIRGHRYQVVFSALKDF